MALSPPSPSPERTLSPLNSDFDPTLLDGRTLGEDHSHGIVPEARKLREKPYRRHITSSAGNDVSVLVPCALGVRSGE